jgi:hypothetical protein
MRREIVSSFVDDLSCYVASSSSPSILGTVSGAAMIGRDLRGQSKLKLGRDFKLL